jgi:trehalose/maltose hydrolase-like predicted phosphorylase
MTHGKCGPWCMYEQHVSADIAFAARQFYYSTGDQRWLKAVGWPLVKGIALFYAARIEPVPAGSAGAAYGNATYVYNNVMGPDEYNYPVRLCAAPASLPRSRCV